jgi:hypothetical protein
MDPVTIATIASSAIAALSTFLLKGSEKLADKIADDVIESRGKIWETIKNAFQGDELITLNLLEKYPKSAEIQNEVKIKLEEKMAANNDLAAQLQELLKKLPGSEVKQNTMTVTGDNNISLQDTEGSHINITR